MNEDERGITPANETAMTMAPRSGGWHVTIEQGNGDVIKEIELTTVERVMLATMLGLDAATGTAHLDFVDFSR